MDKKLHLRFGGILDAVRKLVYQKDSEEHGFSIACQEIGGLLKNIMCDVVDIVFSREPMEHLRDRNTMISTTLRNFIFLLRKLRVKNISYYRRQQNSRGLLRKSG